MFSIRQKKIFWILIIAINVSIATVLILYALKQNINLFYTPSQLKENQPKANKIIRVGGIVVKGSLIKNLDTLEVNFSITDLDSTLDIWYKGVLPDLFKEGQGIIAQGILDATGKFIATQVLAKHDENYMPPEISNSLSKSKSFKSL